MSNLTLGSLFDGSGGFPLAAQNVGIKPLWASEIEPFPIRVTRKKLPNMKHLGDAQKIKGSDITPVDIVTFGSPCTDLSLAGKRDGLHGKQSGLFFEAIRIIREMREATQNHFPRYAVWENVLGSFNSNKGDDFNSIIKFLTSIQGVEFSVPRPKKWSGAGAVLGDTFSLAWRSFDAQYWGVPQQRRRVFLVFCFEASVGRGAQEILFERQEVPRDHPEGRAQRGVTPADPEAGFERTDPASLVRADDKPAEFSYITLSHGGFMIDPAYDVCHLLMATDYKDPQVVMVDTGDEQYLRVITPKECGRLQGFPDDWCDGLVDENPTDETVSFFQRVWDEWNDIRGVKHKTESQVRKWLATEPTDSAMYKMWGNGVALPCVEFIMDRINQVERGEL